MVEPFRFDPKEAKNPTARAIVNKSLSIYFTPGSDEIMNGSFFTLDSLGDTMTAFGNTFLRIEGNTDAKGSQKLNKTLSQKRADSGEQVPRSSTSTSPTRASRPSATAPTTRSPPTTTEAGRQQNRRTDIKVILNAQ